MTVDGIIETYLNGLHSRELLLKLTWEEWLAIAPPYPNGNFTAQDDTMRYQRNGYDWDMHGTLYTPERELDGKRGFVFFHGGAASEKIMDFTPDGRPGLARVLAAQGFKVLSLTFPAIIRRAAFGKPPCRNACRSICSIGSCQSKKFSTAI